MAIRYFIELAYKGTPFHGWQIQPNAITVQELLNKALITIFREEINVVGAGRTDTGVHASYFIAHMDLEKPINDIPLAINKLNKILPKEIAIFKIEKVRPEAHARFDATSRSYEYHINPTKNPFLIDFAWHFKMPLDIDLMNKAAKLLLNFTDFTSFSKTGTQVATNNCLITKAEWKLEQGILKFYISADRFLRNMVRAIVGTLVDIGLGKLTIDNFIKIVESKNRSKAGFSVPPQGLYLTQIEYPKEIFLND